MEQYEIPRNVKATRSFMRLNLKGWAGFLSAPLILGGLTWLISHHAIATAAILILSGFMAYFTFEIDEKTGEPNIAAVMVVAKMFLSSKTLTPKWGGHEHDETKKVVNIYVKAD